MVIEHNREMLSVKSAAGDNNSDQKEEDADMAHDDSPVPEIASPKKKSKSKSRGKKVIVVRSEDDPVPIIRKSTNTRKSRSVEKSGDESPRTEELEQIDSRPKKATQKSKSRGKKKVAIKSEIETHIIERDEDIEAPLKKSEKKDKPARSTSKSSNKSKVSATSRKSGGSSKTEESKVTDYAKNRPKRNRKPAQK